MGSPADRNPDGSEKCILDHIVEVESDPPAENQNDHQTPELQ